MTEKSTALDWLARQRVARLGTAGLQGEPHVVPVCFALSGDQGAVYVTIDQKPKTGRRPLKRIRNIMENPQAALVADHYDEDWSQLGWAMIRGSVDLLRRGAEHRGAQTLLAWKYPQYQDMELAHLPVIALRIRRLTWWGRLDG